MDTKAIKTKLEDLYKVYIETARAEFNEGVKTLFAENPRLKSVAVKAFTRYFNDDDSTNFSVQGDEPIINGYNAYDKEDVYDQYDPNENLWVKSYPTIGEYTQNPQPNPKYDAGAEKAVNTAIAFLQAFDSDIYESFFGDHVEITLTAEGATTSPYTNHD